MNKNYKLLSQIRRSLVHKGQYMLHKLNLDVHVQIELRHTQYGAAHEKRCCVFNKVILVHHWRNIIECSYSYVLLL